MYCSRCGKELMDGAITCPSCGNHLVVTRKPVKTKVNNRRAIIRISIIVAVVLLLVAAGVFVLSIFRNNAYAEDLEIQLADKTFEFQGMDHMQNISQICWLTFYDTGRYRCEVVDFSTTNAEEWFGDYSVKVGRDGVAELYVGTSVYEISVGTSGEIERFSVGYDSYYPIERDPWLNLADWFEEEQFEKTLNENKQIALEMFADISYWNTGDSFDNLIPIIFKDYELTCEPQGDSNNEFIITVSGPYYFNKVNLPTITRQGELSCYVKIGLEENVLSITRDDGIVDAMDVYVILSTYGSYGW